ncbi:MAG: Nif3-like dinuclear metal center hexameric protein [Armatimonadia bacterium]
MTAREIEQIVLEIAPLENGIEGDPNGLLYGDPDQEITGLAVTWTTTVKVLRQAAASGLNFVLSHEHPFFASSPSSWFATYPTEERPHNIARRKAADDHKLVICRCHSNWDGTAGQGVADSIANQLEFGDPIHESHFVRVYEIPRQTLAELAQWAKLRLGLPIVRIAGDLARTVEKVGIAYGGLAQRYDYVDEFLMNGADAVIVGEAIDYSIRAAIDAGIGFIETSHVGSENPGMRNFARLLQERLPNLPVEFIDAGHEWVYR